MAPLSAPIRNGLPLFFASNALYPVDVMPQWVRWLPAVNPLSYEVNALRGLLIGSPTNGWLDFGVLLLTAVLGIAVAWRPHCRAAWSASVARPAPRRRASTPRRPATRRP